jgi:hypothetical protein
VIENFFLCSTKRTAFTLFATPCTTPKKLFDHSLFEKSVRTSNRTPHFTIKKINWLMILKEIISLESENHRKHICQYKICVTDFEAGALYSYQLALKG